MLYSRYIELRFAFLQKGLMKAAPKQLGSVFFWDEKPQPIEDERFDAAYIVHAPVGVFIAAAKDKRFFCVQYCFGLAQEADILDAMAQVLTQEN